MKLTSGARANLFGMGSQLNGLLGCPFQNPMEITIEVLEDEIRLAREARRNEFARYDRYIGELIKLKDELT